MPDMKKWIWLLLPMALGADISLAANMAAAAAAPSTQEAAECPSQNFDAFLAAFMDSPQLQKAYTSRPLESISIDPDAEPEPAPVTKQLDGADLRFPVMPSTKKQKADGLARQLSKLPGGGRQVTLVKPDTDYQLLFSFRKGKCWQLYRVDDESL
jgi:hypothetical protein